MDQDPFTASLFKWEYPTNSSSSRGSFTTTPPQATALPPYFSRGVLGIRDPLSIPGIGMGMGMGMGMQGIGMGLNNGNNNNPNNNASSGGGPGAAPTASGGLEDFFQPYGIRYYTAAKIAEMGFTVSTLVDMREEEVDDMMNSLSHLFRWDLLVGERYGIKAAIRAERRRLEDLEESRRLRHHHHHQHMSFSNTPPPPDSTHHSLDAFSQEGLSEEGGVHEKEVVGSGGGNWEMMGTTNNQHTIANQDQQRKKHRKQQLQARKSVHNMMTMTSNHNNRKLGQIRNFNNNDNHNMDDEMDEEEIDDDEDGVGVGGGFERQREHPFIVTEPGEVARGKKNGLDYLFHLYEQCRDFLIQVQNIAKERGEKCPTKVTNQVFRYAKKAGATYINKPKMRHYVHCYALHCLDEETSNALRRAFKERGENVGAWRQACYKPLVAIASRQGCWDIDAIFNSHPRLSIWYVPTKLRQLCHAERSAAANPTTSLSAAPGPHHLAF